MLVTAWPKSTGTRSSGAKGLNGVITVSFRFAKRFFVSKNKQPLLPAAREPSKR